MPQPPSSYDRLRELEQRRHMRQTGHIPTTRDHQRRYPANTLGPNEDLVAHRRGQHRKHVTISGASPQHRNLLLENAFILLFLGASIWGLYTLIIYLLTHH